MSDERIILEFRALADDVPAPVRVRALLKRALRSYKLDCVKVVGLPDSWDENSQKERNVDVLDQHEDAG